MGITFGRSGHTEMEGPAMVDNVHALVELINPISWLDILQAAGPVMVGIFAGVIAAQNLVLMKQQHRLERERFKFQMIERRLAVYDDFRLAIEVALSNSTDPMQLRERILDVKKRRGLVLFLFKDKQVEYFDALIYCLWAMQVAKFNLQNRSGDSHQYDLAAQA